MVLKHSDTVKVHESEDSVRITFRRIPELVIEEKGITQERVQKLSQHALYAFDPWDAKMAIEYVIAQELDYEWLIDWRDGVVDEWYRKHLYKKFYEGLT